MFNIDQTFQRAERIVGKAALRPIISAMFASEDKSWFEVYQAAVLELDPQKVPQRSAV